MPKPGGSLKDSAAPAAMPCRSGVACFMSRKTTVARADHPNKTTSKPRRNENDALFGQAMNDIAAKAKDEAVKAPGMCNGRSAKRLKTDGGELAVDAPRGRSGGLAPHFLPRRSVPSPDSGAGSSPQSTPSTTRNGSAGAALPRSRSSAGQLSERRRRRLRSRRIERNPAAEMRPPAR